MILSSSSPSDVNAGSGKRLRKRFSNLARDSLTAGIPLRTSGSVMRPNPDGTDQSGPTPFRLGPFQRDFRADHKISMPISVCPTPKGYRSAFRRRLAALCSKREGKTDFSRDKNKLRSRVLQFFRPSMEPSFRFLIFTT
jgi:hypothetical protein